MRWAIFKKKETDEMSEVDAYLFDQLALDLNLGELHCPVCTDDVFFVERHCVSKKNEKSIIKYFSHKKAELKIQDCPIRSENKGGNISDKRLKEIVEVIIKTSVHLNNFKYYLEKTFGISLKNQISNYQNETKALFEDINQNWYKKVGIRVALCLNSLENMLSVFTMFAPFLAKEIPYLKGEDISYLYDNDHINSTFLIWKCLHLPRERANLKSLLELSIIFLQNHSIKTDLISECSSEDKIIFWSFGLLHMVPWHKIVVEKMNR